MLAPVSAGRGAPDGDRPKAAMSSSPEVDSDFASEISLRCRRSPARGRGPRSRREACAAPGRRPVHRARRRHRGRVPGAAAGAGRPCRRLDRGHAGQRRELAAGAVQAGRDRWFCGAGRAGAAPGQARPGDLHRLGQGARSGGRRHRDRRGHGDLRRRAHPGPASQPGRRGAGQGRGPDRAHPRHLRPARPEQGGQGPGGAGTAGVPAAPAARLGRVADPAGRRPRGGRRRYRRPRARRDQDRDGPAPDPDTDRQAAPRDRRDIRGPRGAAPPAAPQKRPFRRHSRVHERREIEHC